jgi:hypothetical protein
MKDAIEVFRSLFTEFGLSTTLLLMISLGEALVIRYVYLEWRKDVTSFTEAAKSMSEAGEKITGAVGSLGHTLAEIRGALFVRPNPSPYRKEGEGQ